MCASGKTQVFDDTSERARPNRDACTQLVEGDEPVHRTNLATGTDTASFRRAATTWPCVVGRHHRRPVVRRLGAAKSSRLVGSVLLLLLVVGALAQRLGSVSPAAWA
jgi:hypothetical protein